ncbi:hypothetical protein SIPHO062v1_p0035 [Vibrio phage PS17B.1]|nr:hypothetical protein SIPHO062v1_p0035 [Vibrio phage PS17B.1]
MRKLTTREFIERSRTVHGDRYDYSFVKYVNTVTKVEIVCKTHGVFKQVPNSHMNGNGCRSCSYEVVREVHAAGSEKFIIKARQIHGDTYDYDHVEYVNNKTKVAIMCAKHGEFHQTPNDHISGYGCANCGLQRTADSARYDSKEFIRRARLKHGDRYDYSIVSYTRANCIIDIKCEKHGVFHKRATKHLQGQGCPMCSRRRTDMTYLYVLYGESRTKIGITTNWRRREQELLSQTPFPFDLLGLWFVGGYLDALAIEKALHTCFKGKNAKLTDFQGATEWFDMTPFEPCDLLTSTLGTPENDLI